MDYLKYTLLVSMVVLCSLYSINANAEDTKPEASHSEAAPDDLEFVLELYGWLASAEIITAGGGDVEIGIDDILDNLDFTFMAVLGARKNRWSFMADVIYMDLESDSNSNLSQRLQLTNIGLQAWSVNPFVSYELFGSKKGSFQLLAGARYLDIEVETEIMARPPLPPIATKASLSTDVWDGVVGIRGFYNLADRWFVPYRVDFGTGDSDYTLHAFAGIGYRFDSFKLLLAYRYLGWEFEDGALLDDLQVSGPVLGALFTF